MKDQDKTKEQLIKELEKLRKRNCDLEDLETQRKQIEEALRESEIKFRSVAQSATDAIISIDSTGNIISWNRGAQIIFGYAEEELLGKSVTILMPEIYKDNHLRGLKRVNSTGKTRIIGKTVEFAGLRKDGSEFPLELSLSTWKIGERRFYTSIIRDISERKQVEEKLRESEIRYRMLFEQSPDGVLIIDPQTITAIEFNETAHRQLGYTREEFKTLRIFDYEAKEKPEETKTHIEKVLREGRDDFETLHHTKDGKLRNVLVTVKTIDLGGRRFVHCIFRDTTELKRAEEALKNYAAELEEANHLKDLFTDIIRHDLLNPLGIIKTATEQILITETNDVRMHNMLQMVKRNADKLIDMIQSASMYAMLQSTEKLEMANLDLDEIFAVIANNFKSQLEEKNMKLEYISDGGGCCIKANPMIDSVFSNLLSNAIKYSPAGKKIEVNVTDWKEHFKIFIKDWGYGISDEDKPKLFTRFHRVNKMGVKGTGLGLAIVKRVVELHGGRVWIENNPEGGSVFCVEIPKA